MGLWDDSPDEKQVIEEASGDSKNPDIVRFDPKEGENVVRIVGSYKWFHEYWVQKVKRTVIAGPLEKCPIYNHPKKEEQLEQARQLRKAGKEKEAKELFRKTFGTYKPRVRYVVNIIDRADGKMKIWKFSRTVKEHIMTIVEKYGDPNSYDLIVTRRGKGKNTEYTVMPDRENKPLTDEDKNLKTYNLANIFKPTPLERVRAYMEGKIPSKPSNSGGPEGQTDPREGSENASEGSISETMTDDEVEELNSLGDDEIPF